MGRLHEQGYLGWDRLDGCAARYHRLTQKNGGTISIKIDPEIGEQRIYDTRTPEQVDLANKIVDGSYGLIYGLAYAALKGRGVKLAVNGDREIKIKLKYFRNIFDVEDLVSIGCFGVLRNLARYDPGKSGISYFIRQRSVSEMHRHAWDYGRGVVHVPEDNLIMCRQIVLDSMDQEDAIAGIVQNFKLEPEKAALIYNAITGYSQDMHEIQEHADHNIVHGDDKIGHMTFEQLNLTSLNKRFDPYSNALNDEISLKIISMIDRLDEKSRDVVNRNYGIDQVPESLEDIGKSMDSNRFAMFETRKRAILKMRRMKKALSELEDLVA